MQARRVLTAIAALAVCLAVVDLAAARSFFDLIARGIAWLADPLLDTLGLPVNRQGNELRAADGAWAVVVSEVCDGHGLVAAWAAICAALAPGSARGIAATLIGLLAIQVFNLLRVIALVAGLSHGPDLFQTLHLEAFPLLTAALMAALTATVAPVGARRLAAALALGLGLAVLWYSVAENIAGAILVPFANAVLAAFGPDLVRGISGAEGAWSIATTLVARAEPLAFYSLPIHPADFLVALPALLAAAIVARRGAVVVALALCAAGVALALGTVTGLWSAMEQAGAPLQKAPGGGTAAEIVPAEQPGAIVRGVARLAQNLIVHANLLVLPALLLAARYRPDED
ncbi:hypothetical protein P1J78_21200 [Psychromarinibacter sp. C21-152]|uniref:Exosortase/archaeosortase family protein n=1 Tax=Psychromarinibacter sediminicola TaxID=3033385 RepID=A0AAE3TA29_9RHOB|nr:hypothetical protein [Psychromarinibacter sediminicola]MDF0603260.1 hypothetical protein [Psychromarinibacter sediminicola]